MTFLQTYRQRRPQSSPSRGLICFLLLAVVGMACGRIPEASLSGPTTEASTYGFSVQLDTSLVNAGWGIRTFPYQPAQTEQYRSMRLPLLYEMFVDRPSFNGRGFQPLDIAGERIERGRLATRVVVRVLEKPDNLSFEALVDTVRNLNQSVLDVSLNGLNGIELSRRDGNSNEIEIYRWSHTAEMVPRMIFQSGRFLYFLNTFESQGGNADTTEVNSVLQTFRLAP